MKLDPLKIMVVDDEPGIRNALQTHFELDGFKVITFDSASKALEYLSKNKVQIILSDINMPNMDGLEFLECLKDVGGEAVVIMITAYTTLMKVLNARVNGAFDYILKPFKNLDEINEVVDRAIIHSQRWRNVVSQTRETRQKVKRSQEIAS